MKIRIAAVTATVLLTLTGCAGTAEQAASEPQTAAQQAQETPAEKLQEADAPALTVEEQWFVDNEVWEAFRLTDQELLDAADLACENFKAGQTGDTMTLPGISAELTRYFANGAREQFCPGAGF